MHKKTTEFCTSFGIQENVSRLHVSMNHIAAVNELESGAHLTADARYLRLGQWPFQLMHNAVDRTSDTVLQINLPAHTNVYWNRGLYDTQHLLDILRYVHTTDITFLLHCLTWILNFDIVYR